MRSSSPSRTYAVFIHHFLRQRSSGVSSQLLVLSHLPRTNFCIAPVLPGPAHVLSCRAVLGRRWSSLFLHASCSISSWSSHSITSSSAAPSTLRVKVPSLRLVVSSLLFPQASCLPDLNAPARKLHCCRAKTRAATCSRATRRHPDPHVQDQHVFFSLQPHDLSWSSC